jgi:hypothetical protein
MTDDKFPIQRSCNFEARDATPEEIDEWQSEASDYHETVNNVLGSVIAGSFFQFFTLGSMILAFYIIQEGLKNA